MNINKLSILTIGGLTSALISSSVLADGNEIQMLKEAKVKISQAMEIAQSNIAGDVMSVDFDEEHGNAIWDIEVVDAQNNIHQLEIDAMNGQVLASKIDND